MEELLELEVLAAEEELTLLEAEEEQVKQVRLHLAAVEQQTLVEAAPLDKDTTEDSEDKKDILPAVLEVLQEMVEMDYQVLYLVTLRLMQAAEEADAIIQQTEELEVLAAVVLVEHTHLVL
jgi:hypothetical protein